MKSLFCALFFCLSEYVFPTLLFRKKIAGISESSPLHQYNMDVGDDDVFMVREDILGQLSCSLIFPLFLSNWTFPWTRATAVTARLLPALRAAGHRRQRRGPAREGPRRRRRRRRPSGGCTPRRRRKRQPPLPRGTRSNSRPTASRP